MVSSKGSFGADWMAFGPDKSKKYFAGGLGQMGASQVVGEPML
jgi:hypothetical protein